MSGALQVEWITDGIRVEIHPDCCPDNPLTDYAIGHHAYFHNRYVLGNCGHLYQEPLQLQEFFDEEGDDVVKWQVYMYDHSSLAFSLGSPFSCKFDSGQIGYAYMTKAEIRTQWQRKRVTDDLIHGLVRQCLEGELEAYERYLNGWYVGYQVMRRDDVLDSCFGIDDQDYALKLGREAAEEWLHTEAEGKANA